MQTPIPRVEKSAHGYVMVGGFVWLVLIAAGFFVLGREEFTPVPAGHQSEVFPGDSAIQLARDRPTLILFVHPQCPCTRATLHELDDALVSMADKVMPIVVFTLPNGVPTGWEQGDLWRTAANLPAVQLMRDPGGAEARRFGVTGSGHALLYDAAGRLLFSGGITASRGHEGDNPGRSSIESLVLTGRSDVHRTPVFGCSLL